MLFRSSVKVIAHTSTALPTASNYGLIASGFTMTTSTINLEAEKNAIAIKVGNGDTQRDFDPGYAPTVLNSSMLVNPTDAVVNIISVQAEDDSYDYYETFYENGSTTDVVTEVTLG